MRFKNHSYKLALAAGAIAAAVVTTSAYAQQGMGIGNNNPQEMLDVSGAIKLGTTTSTNAGTIRWTGTEFQGWDGTQWITFGGGIATQLTEAQVEAFVTNGPIDLFAGTTLNGSAILTTEVDGSVTNEIQDLQLVGNILTITNNGTATQIDLSPYVNAAVSLDAAYDQGGAGLGREINATDGAVRINGDDGFLVTGTVGSGDAIEVSGAGTRMFFNPKKAAVRAGYVNGNQWDDANIGNYSTAMGYGTTADGARSTAMGNATAAQGASSTAMGSGSIAIGESATAMGYNSTAEGVRSTAIGNLNLASGDYSTALGNGTTALADESTALGYTTTASGYQSTAMGSNTASSGSYSTAMGYSTTASGNFSTAIGNSTTASGSASTAMGQLTDATGSFSTAMGENTTASGDYSTVMGRSTTASGDFATAMGINTIASGVVSTAIGEYTTSSGGASTALGSFTTASGNISTTMGSNTTAPSFVETAVGRYNTTYTPASATGWNTADRLFVIGNGTSSSAQSNALTIYKSGKMNINDAYDMPTADGAAGQVMTTDGAGTVSFVDPGTLNPVIFANTSGVTSNQNGTYATDDFVFGSPQLADNGNWANDNRFYFDKSKAAFRAGRVQADQWDVANVGNYSVALGSNTTASGDYATALGAGTTASGTSSTAMGTNTNASEVHSTAMGDGTAASGYASTAMGAYTTASGSKSTAMGDETTASGSRSTAMGNYTTARSFVETAVGRYNTNYAPASATGWNTADRLFVVGNGTSNSARSNALTIYKDGRMNINDAYDMPTTDGAAGQVMTTDGAGTVSFVDPSTLNPVIFANTSGVTSNQNGTYATDDFVFGSPQLADNGNTANDNRFFFDKSKGAFRAGRALGTQWDDANVGNYSVGLGASTTASANYAIALGAGTTASGVTSTAMGASTTASGDYSTAMGDNTTASGDESTAMGYNTTASGVASTAMGAFTTASGVRSTAMGASTTASGIGSTAMGRITTASGDWSTAMGASTTAPSYAETAVGRFNTTYTPASATGWNTTDRLFVIGNGTSNSATSDAMVVLKNGNTGLGTSTPTSDLHLKMSASDFPNPTTGGITLEQSNSTAEWQIWNSNPYLSFARNNVRVAYVNNASGAWTVTSDRRVKKDIEPMEDVLSKVMQLNTVKYRYNHNADDATKTRGFIAQEVQEVFPDLVYTEDGSQLGIAPSDFGILSIKAIQEQQAQIEAQQKLINELMQRIQQLENK